MTKQSRTDEALWMAVQDLDRELLDPGVPTDVIDAAARSIGLDPHAVRAEGRALAAAAFERKRRGWMTAAREKIALLREKAKATTKYAEMGKQMLLEELERWRQHPAIGGEVRAAFRNRKPEESSEDDLRALLEEIERVAAMHEADAEKGGGGDGG